MTQDEFVAHLKSGKTIRDIFLIMLRDKIMDFEDEIVIKGTDYIYNKYPELKKRIKDDIK